MTVRIIVGDALDKLRELPDQSARCCVTSPPYWGLRDYGIAGQLGLEASPYEFVDKMVSVFREVHRVLTDDGTLWLNIGDSYVSGASSQRPSSQQGTNVGGWTGKANQIGRNGTPAGMKIKDLVLMPARLAIALQDDGWWVRSDIIWAKPNPMPEAVTDRPTKAHEYIFLLSKSPRYFYDADAIREALSENTHSRGGRDVPGNWNDAGFANSGEGHGARTRKNNPKTPDSWDTSKGEGGHGSIHKHGRETSKIRSGNKARKAASDRGVPVPESAVGAVAGSVPWEDNGSGRNARSVWTISPEPFKEAHFATFPVELPKRCILAGSAKGDTVLDPFGGAGTTGLVADRLGRNAVLLELNPEYAAMAERRIHGDAPLFAEVSTS